MKRNALFLLLSAGLLAAVTATSSCQTERKPIDKTNPLALDKKLFEGEYYYKQTVIDVPYTVDYTFPGETNSLKIVRFEITENALIVYATTNHINYTDINGVKSVVNNMTVKEQ